MLANRVNTVFFSLLILFNFKYEPLHFSRKYLIPGQMLNGSNLLFYGKFLSYYLLILIC